jgi:hypothetical protein
MSVVQREESLIAASMRSPIPPITKRTAKIGALRVEALRIKIRNPAARATFPNTRTPEVGLA